MSTEPNDTPGEDPVAKTSTLSVFGWLEALLAHNDFVGAERLVEKTPEDFERIYSLLILAKAYLDQGELERVATRSSQAVSLWRMSKEEWWFLPLLGDLLRKLVECGQVALTRQLMQESVSMIEGGYDAWLETHGWCGLAQGSISLGYLDDGEMFFARAVKVAESRPTQEERDSARSIVDIALAVVDSPT